MRQAPFAHRFIEGITTSAMPLGYLLAGGDWNSCLFLVYIIHSIASYFYHVYPSENTYFFHVEFINILITERVYAITGNIWIYMLCVCNVLFEPTRSHTFVIIYVFLFFSIYSSYTGDYTTFHNFFFSCVLIFYCFSCFFHSFEDQYDTLSTLSTTLYHVYLGVASFIEVGMYQHNDTHTDDHIPILFIGIIRCIGFFLFTFLMTTKLIQEPRRLRSILSCATAIVLSPLSVYVIIRQLLHSRNQALQDEAVHTFMTCFYLAYVASDMIVGGVFYPQYFPFLEGWLHHIGTTLAFSYSYFWFHQNNVVICMNCVIEISSIILCLARIFYDNPTIMRWKHKTFYHLFLWSRIIMPCFLLIYFFPLYSKIAVLFSLSMTSLNLYWITKMSHRSF